MSDTRLSAAFLALVLGWPSSAHAGRINAGLSRVAPQVGARAHGVPSIPDAVIVPQPASAAGAAGGWGDLARRVASRHPEIPEAALRKAFRYMAGNRVSNADYVAIADFDRPSNEKRLSVIRTADGSVESYLVAHGRGSGDKMATRFSNQPKSRMSSLGLYLTGEVYTGKHGRSLRLHGQESSNDNALSRAIVIHPAKYVNDGAAAGGSIGRSWGCPAVDPRYSDEIINHLKGGAVLLIHSSRGS